LIWEGLEVGMGRSRLVSVSVLYPSSAQPPVIWIVAPEYLVALS